VQEINCLVIDTVRVIYDISVLGNGFYLPIARTGVFRYVENLAQELVKSEAIYSLSSTSSIMNYFQCCDYLQSNPILAAMRLETPDVNNMVLRLYHYLHAHTLLKQSNPFYIDGMNRIATSADYRIMADRTINRDALATAEIYHSPYYPFSEQVKRDRKVKKIITIHDLVPVLQPQFFQHRKETLVHKALRSIDHETWVTCVSQSTKDDLCNFLPEFDPSRSFVTQLAASKIFYQCRDPAVVEGVRKKLNIPDGPYVLSLATLEPRKNIAQTIRCFARVVKEEKINDLSLVLVGTKGWDFEDILNEMAVSPELQKKIILAGYVHDEDLAPLYSGATMFVYPSFYEGFGLPPLEAMQCGVPVITSNTSSLPEVVGQAGIMVKPEDGDALCQAMLNIYNSSDLRQKMTMSSLAQASQFSWSRCAEQTIHAYQAAMA
jgi:glycosyltransferase involved in cell wall biosynthesis